MDTQVYDNAKSIGPAMRLAYFSSDGTAMPLLRPILIAGIAAGTLLVIQTCGIWVAAAFQVLGLHRFPSEPLMVPLIFRGAVSAAALVMVVGLIGCLRHNPAMRLLSLGAIATVIVISFAAVVAHYTMLHLAYGLGAAWLQMTFMVGAKLVETTSHVLVPVLLWYLLRRADVRALFVDETLRVDTQAD